PEVDEDDYRYPGPKPQTRETAICMLADGIEAASRAMRNPTPARLKGLVQKMINKAFTDGQLDECDLTLRDLNEIAKALTRILTGIFHQRPEYPERDDDRRQKVTRAID
ncbi:MAG: phosphohydrolase, partial [Bradymonadaceae bacterium]